MKAQAVIFQRTIGDELEDGIAILKTFNLHDPEYIIDMQGRKVKTLHWYDLKVGPLSYCDPEWRES